MITLLQRTRRPDITFCRNGRISITARVVRALNIQPGDSINVAFHHDECYLLVCHHDNNTGRHIATCYPSKKGSHNFCANSATLCRLMFYNCRIQGTRAAFMVGKEVTVLGELCMPIIYKNPL